MAASSFDLAINIARNEVAKAMDLLLDAIEQLETEVSDLRGEVADLQDDSRSVNAAVDKLEDEMQSLALNEE